MANWKGHETHNPNHMNKSMLSEVDWGAHDSSVFLFLVNIDYDAKPNESPIQGLWGELHVNPNRDSPNGYSTVKRVELQPVTLSH